MIQEIHVVCSIYFLHLRITKSHLIWDYMKYFTSIMLHKTCCYKSQVNLNSIRLDWSYFLDFFKIIIIFDYNVKSWYLLESCNNACFVEHYRSKLFCTISYNIWLYKWSIQEIHIVCRIISIHWRITQSYLIWNCIDYFITIMLQTTCCYKNQVNINSTH